MNSTDNYTKVSKIEDEKGFDVSTIPFILQQTYIQNHTEELSSLIGLTSRKDILTELTHIKRELKRPIVPIQRYAKTKHAAAYLDVDPSYLDKKRRKGLFTYGIHFFKPSGSSIVLWDLDALGNWVRGMEENNENVNIVNSMFK